MGRLTTLNGKLSLNASFPFCSLYWRIYLWKLVHRERIVIYTTQRTCTAIFVNNVGTELDLGIGVPVPFYLRYTSMAHKYAPMARSVGI